MPCTRSTAAADALVTSLQKWVLFSRFDSHHEVGRVCSIAEADLSQYDRLVNGSIRARTNCSLVEAAHFKAAETSSKHIVPLYYVSLPFARP